MLEVRGLHVSHGRLDIVRGVSLELVRGEIALLLGANGSGKSSLLEAISGVRRSTGGDILLQGVSIRGEPVHRRFARGVVHVPQDRAIFTQLTVIENLMLGVRRHDITMRLAEVLPDFPEIAARLDASARALSGGQQQLLAIARGLMARPEFLLLDEPTTGLSPIVTQRVFALLAMLKKRGMGILLVDQNVSGALAVADRVYVLDRGKIARSGAVAELPGERQLADITIGTVCGRNAS